MKSLAPLLLASSLGLAGLAFADPNMGPITHERTDTPKKANAHVGRYLYVGTAPKFDGGEIDLTVSKMSLTLRATGWMTQAKIDAYASQLYKRWEQIDSTMQDTKFVLHPLVSIQAMAEAIKATQPASIAAKNNHIKWASIAGQYSTHVLENRGVTVLNGQRNARSLSNAGITNEYREDVSTAILRYYFNDNSLTTEAVKNDNMLRDRLLSPANARALFQKHYKSVYTPSVAKIGYAGYITFVYPIAATVAGPNDQPKEGVRTLMSYGTIESRWWSDKWDDEFGGLPFILINSAGVAFHGPITNYAPNVLDVWYLRRGYVSHGCHRMDTSDIIELRNILPRKMTDLAKVKLTILNNFDVVDWNNDGKKEVIDVKYYNVPTSVGINTKTTDYSPEAQSKSYFATHAYASKYYNKATDTITGAPQYSVAAGGTLAKNGFHGPLPIARFEYQPSRILQYKELGTQLVPYDDNRGKFPPTYFLNN